MGIGTAALSILSLFLANRSLHVMVDSCWSKLVNVVSGLPQICILHLLFFLLCTFEHFSIMANMLVCYADDSNLIAIVQFPGVRVPVAEILNSDLGKAGEWCNH